jgi:hypothetical protein
VDPEEPCEFDCEPCTVDCGPVDPEEPCQVNCGPTDPGNPTGPNGPTTSSGPLPGVTGIGLSLAPVTTGGALPSASPEQRPALPPAAPIGGFAPPTSGDGGLIGARSEGTDALAWGLILPMFALVGIRRRDRTQA